MEPVIHLSQKSFLNMLSYVVDELSVRNVFFSSKKPDCRVAKIPVTSFPRIDIPLSGSKRMQFAFNNQLQDVVMKPGDIHYCPPMCWKLPCWNVLHTMTSIVYTPEYIRITYINHDQVNLFYEREGSLIFYHTAKPLSTAGYAVIHALNTFSEARSNTGAETDLMRALLKITLEELKQDQPRTYGKAHMTWLRINQYIQENFYYPINRAHVASEFGLNPSYVSRLFVKNGTDGFNTTLRNLRMEHAALLLVQTSMTVDEVCNSCGYQSTTFFCAAFKKHFGVPPGKYRTLEQPRRKSKSLKESF